MSKTSIVAAVVALFAAAPAFAQGTSCPCGNGALVTTGPALAALLGGKTVCAAVGSETWQEFHSGSTEAGGPLIDYKRGPNDRVDPSAQVGTWAVRPVSESAKSGTQVIYNYGGGRYSYSVCQAGNAVNFCGPARNITGATLINGQVACSAAAVGTSERRSVQPAR